MSIPASRTSDRPLILFDGVCGLCNAWVDYVIERDPRGVFVFAPLQSAVGQRWLEQAGLSPDYLDSIVLVDERGLWTHSTAVLRVFRKLTGVHRVAALLIVVPQAVRDWVYRVVATYRYQWFGQRMTCRLPSPEERKRFLV